MRKIAGVMLWLYTDKEDESLCGCFFNRHTVLFHATHNGADEVDVEDGIDVDQMKDDCYPQEPQAPETSHAGWLNGWIDSAAAVITMVQSGLRDPVLRVEKADDA